MIEQLKLHETGEAEWMSKSSIINRAIRMEKEQIKDAHFAGWGDAYDYLKDEHCDARQAEDYYNETYGKGNI